MKKTVLIIDDSKVERVVLSIFLKEFYNCLLASSGKEALSILQDKYNEISVIILDIVMPEMDGFEVLKQIRDNTILMEIPVVVTSSLEDQESREKALEYGVKGFVTKPYNRVFLLHTLQNAIQLYETMKMTKVLWHDRLTGLLNRESFFIEAEHFLKAHQDTSFIMACLDIDNFKVINYQYGTEKGDSILKFVSSCIYSVLATIEGLACRYSADCFIVLFPTKYLHCEKLRKAFKKMEYPTEINRTIKFRVGLYSILDINMPLSSMIDKATLAEKSIKGQYKTYVAYYDDSMLEELLHEQHVINIMDKALEDEEFEIWFQPQFNHETKAMIGSEALVRWRHEGTLIPPNNFIPIFERNGFVYKVDQFIWEAACKFLENSIKTDANPLPVSVNISRYDLFQKDFFKVICHLVEKYKIPVNLLRLEVTESAFSESTKLLVTIVNKLIAYGFTVEIDDFGSAYSSLNTLKDVRADILKLDMKFLEDSNESKRGGSIIESIVRMARWLGMAIIAEGVETQQQADYLLSIGCEYIQGYLYSKPIPLSEYTDLCKKVNKEPNLTRLKTVETWNNNAFWDPSSMETLIFNSYVGAACIFEYKNNQTELLRFNDRFKQIFLDDFYFDFSKKHGNVPFLDENNLAIALTNIKNSIQEKKESKYELQLDAKTGKVKYVRVTIRLIATALDRHMFYCVVDDITEQRLNEIKIRESERKENENAKLFESIISNINGGVTATIIRNGKPKFIVVNNQYYKQLGYTKEQYENEVQDKFSRIHEEDRQRIIEQFRTDDGGKDQFTMEYRVITRDGKTLYVHNNIRIINIFGIEEPVHLSVINDITELHNAQQKILATSDKLKAIMNHAGNGFTAIVIRGNSSEFLFANQKYFELLGYDNKCTQLPDVTTALDFIHPDDRERVYKAVTEANRTRSDSQIEYRIIKLDGSIIWVNTIITITELINIDCPVQISTYVDITKEKEFTEQLQFLNTSAHSILANENSEIAINELLKQLNDYFNADRAYVIELDYNNKLTNNTYEICADGIQSEKDLLQNIPFEDSNYWFSMLNEYGFLVIKDVNTLEDDLKDLKDLLLRQNIYSIAIAPLWRDGKLIAFAGLDNPRLELNRISRLSALCDYISILIAKRDMSIQKVLPVVLSTVLESSSDLALIKTKDLHYLCCSNFAAKAMGYDSSKDIIGKTDYELYDKDIADFYIYTDKEIIEKGKAIVNYVEQTPQKDGKQLYLNISKYPLLNTNGEVFGVYVFAHDITEQMEAKDSLHLAEEEYKIAARHSGITIGRYDIAKHTIAISSENAKRLDLPEIITDVPEGRIKLGKISSNTTKACKEFFKNIGEGKKEEIAVFQELFSSGWKWIEAHSTTIFNKQNKPVSAIISFFDVTDKQEKEAIYNSWYQSLQLRDENSFTFYRCNLSKGSSFESHNGKLLKVNFDNTKYSFNECTNEYSEKFVSFEFKDKFKQFLNPDVLLAAYYRNHRSDFLEYKETQENGEVRWLRLTVDLIEYPNSKDIEAFLMFEDIDEHKKREILTLEHSQIDDLTKVLNRGTFISRFTEIINNSKQEEMHSLFIFDIDNFKHINDCYGHGVGDDVLCELTSKVKSSLRRDDLVGRLGGDEFFVMLRNIPNKELVERKAKQLCDLHIVVGDNERITISMGIVMIPKDGKDFEELYKKTDKALYKKKKDTKNGYFFVED